MAAVLNEGRERIEGNRDEAGMWLEQEIVALTEPRASSTQAVLYGLDEPRYLSLPQARRILSHNEKGEDVRTNTNGNNLVVRLGNVLFKRNADFPLVEQAVYQTSLLLGGNIVVPSRLLIIVLPIAGRTETIAVQASLAVEGVSLDALLRLPACMRALDRILGAAEVLRVLPTLLNRSYYQEWLGKNAFSESLSWEEQSVLFLDRLYQLPKKFWPLELSEGNPGRAQVEKALMQSGGLRSQSLFPLLALIERYPVLAEGQYLGDIFFLPESFMVMQQLYTHHTPEEMRAHIQNLYAQFDAENVSKHLLLALLIEPRDHKSDSFMVRVKRDDKGKLLPFEMVAIDNDDALQGTLISTPRECRVEVRTILYGLIQVMPMAFSARVRERLLSFNLELSIVQWLAYLEQVHREYRALNRRGIIFPGLYSQLHLDEAVPLGYITRLYTRLVQLRSLLSERSVELPALLLAIEPILGRYYQELMKLYQHPQSLMLALYDGREVGIEKILQERLQDRLLSGETIQDVLQKSPRAERPRFQSYWKALISWVQDKHLLDPDESKVQQEVLEVLLRAMPEPTSTIEELILSPAMFAKLYASFPQFISFLKPIPRVFLQLDALTRLMITEPLILFHVMSIPVQGPVLVEGLIRYGASVHVQRGSDGYTPLHFAARFGWVEAIPILLQAGSDYHRLDLQNQSALDKAVRYGYVDGVRQLLLAGAGRVLQLENGLSFLKAYADSHPELCQQLLSRSVELSWHMALQAMTEEKETAEQVLLEGMEGRRYLKSSIYQQIFENRKSFPKENDYGRHAVKAISVEVAPHIITGMHLKENPDLPGREFMVHSLAKRLFGLITPTIALWRFSRMQGLFHKLSVGYPVLASQTIRGQNLLDALESDTLKLDFRSYSEAVILAMLINPEDGRADNYIVAGRELISIDNDRAFVRPVALTKTGEELEGPPGLQVKTILYCMDLMQEPIHPQVRERILGVLNDKPADFLRLWLEDLRLEQNRIEKLFSSAERKHLAQNNIQLDIVFKPSIVEDIYQKLVRLQNTLVRYPQMSLLQILRRVIPELGVRYGASFANHSTAQERFRALIEGCFEVRHIKVKGGTKEYHQSDVMTSARVVELTREIRLEAHLVETEAKATVEVALQRLQEIEKQYSELRTIQQELLQGNPQRFHRLLSDQQEWVVNGKGMDLPGIDFGAMKREEGSIDVKRQQEIWNILQKVSFRRLRVLNFEALTDEMLRQFLRSMKSLLALEIVGCSRLTDRGLDYIVLQCPALEKLRLVGLPLIHSGSNFPALRVLMVEDCSNLKEWSHQETGLERIEFHRCAKLSRLRIAFSLRMKKVQLNNCAYLESHSVFYERYPRLLSLSSEDLPKEFLQALDTMLVQSLDKAGITRESIPPSIIEMLTEMVGMRRRSLEIILPKLIKLLSNIDGNIRIKAAKALVKLSPSHQTMKLVIDALLLLLRDEAQFFSCRVAETLGELPHALETMNIVIDALLPLLRDKDSYVRLRVVEALGKLPYTPETVKLVLDALLLLLIDKSWEVSNSVAKVIVRLSPISKTVKLVIDAWLPSLRNRDDEIRRGAVELLGELPYTPETVKLVIDALLPLLRDKSSYVRIRAAEILVKLSPTSVEIKLSMDALLPLLRDENWDVRRSAADALGELPSTPETVKLAIDALLPLLRDEAAYVRRSTVEALGKMPYTSETVKSVIDALWSLLRNEYLYVKISAAEVLGKLLHTPETVKLIIDELLPLLRDKDWDVKNSAVKVLVKLSHTPETVKLITDVLLPFLRDEKLDVRREASRILEKLSHTHETVKLVIDVMLPILKNEDSGARIRGAKALAKLAPTPETVKLVIDALLPLLGNKSDDVHSDVITSLATVCDTQHFMTCIANWIESTYTKTLLKPESAPMMVGVPHSLSLDAVVSPVALRGEARMGIHVDARPAYSAGPGPGPGYSSDPGGVAMLPQFTLASAADYSDPARQTAGAAPRLASIVSLSPAAAAASDDSGTRDTPFRAKLERKDG